MQDLNGCKPASSLPWPRLLLQPLPVRWRRQLLELKAAGTTDLFSKEPSASVEKLLMPDKLINSHWWLSLRLFNPGGHECL